MQGDTYGGWIFSFHNVYTLHNIIPYTRNVYSFTNYFNEREKERRRKRERALATDC